jgi:hypothetical protein
LLTREEESEGRTFFSRGGDGTPTVRKEEEKEKVV